MCRQLLLIHTGESNRQVRPPFGTVKNVDDDIKMNVDNWEKGKKDDEENSKKTKYSK